MEKTVLFCGRVVTASELNLVHQIIADFPRLSQAELAHTICELLEWRRPNGKLKTMEALDWLQKWQGRDCLPALPELKGDFGTWARPSASSLAPGSPSLPI